MTVTLSGAIPNVATSVMAPAIAAPPSAGRVLVAVMRSEWTKLRTVRSTIWALLFTFTTMIGLGALLTALEASRWDRRTAGEVAAFDPLIYSFAGVNLAQLSIGILGVLVMTSEYATGSVKLTMSATPQRALLLTAKVATFALVTVTISILSCGCTFAVGQAILGPEHGGVSVTDPAALRAVIGAALYLTLIGTIAVGLGTLLRHTAGAVAVLVAILLVIPGLTQLLPAPWNQTVTKYLPSPAGEAMATYRHFPNHLSAFGGLGVLIAYTAVTLALAGIVLVRRDA
ncbi:MAG: transporter permease subunit [Pseudonocardiales bacterium]|nr:transporter permease subunit [Pseudonocardiales bacterium]